jgi:peptidoglycan/LPS O-acetylase OafA/YrhL
MGYFQRVGEWMAGFERLAPQGPRLSAREIPAAKDRSLEFERGGSDQSHYLRFVDGLRAVSILAVVAFHVGIPGIPGGFVGVDIFFVISGFLIINQIKSGLSAGRFSIFTFYAQRALRILPPYFIVLLVTFALAAFVLPTTAVYWDFFASASLAPLMVSNVVFYLSQGYFDISGIEKPLLHTWTLSVEEQFYLVTPVLLMLLFYLGKRRFGTLAATIGIALAAVSLAGAIAETTTTGRNPAFYLSQWRAWEFIAGGLIGAQLVSAIKRLPPALIEIIGWIGAGLIILAIGALDAAMPFPSWRAVFPVAGAVLVIVCGLARPQAAVARFLALPWMVAIGLVSYSWYLWHWPILSYIRIVRLDEASLLFDSLGGGLLAFLLACLTYRYVEQPIRRWRKTSGRLKHPARIVFGFVAACCVIALIGASTALGGYWVTKSLLADRYGIEGKGVLEPGCESKGGFAEDCFKGPLGILVGDSHATVLWGTFAKRFDEIGARLVSLARGGCDPLNLSPPQRDKNRRDDCARLIAPYERLAKRTEPISFAVISGFWSSDPTRLLTDMISELDPVHTRILLVGPVPYFPKPGLQCVVLSDRYAENRDRCGQPRSEVDAMTAASIEALRAMPKKFPNVRYINPIDIFCDQNVCRPYWNNEVFYLDSHHLSPAGADKVFDYFEKDFLWVAGKS